jgi:hypothetical protein
MALNHSPLHRICDMAWLCYLQNEVPALRERHFNCFPSRVRAMSFWVGVFFSFYLKHNS